jgi:hypothetical protein
VKFFYFVKFFYVSRANKTLKNWSKNYTNNYYLKSRPDQALEGITVALFDKLRSTADFFMQLMNNFSEDAEHLQDHSLIEKIKNLKLDLNRSIEICNKSKH